MKKRIDKTNRKFNSRMQARLLLVFCVVSLAMLGLVGRIFYLQQTDGDRYAKQVLSRQTYKSSVLPFRRGDIIDTNGTVLAHSVLQYRLILDPKLLLECEKGTSPTIEALTKYLGIKAETTTGILKEKPKSQYVIVQKNLEYKTVQKFKSMQAKDSDIVGVFFEEEYTRTYPNKKLASDILGFTSTDNKGFFGIEEYYNDELNGTNGREYGYYDSELDIERIAKKAVNGNSVVTTINADVQRIIQEKTIEFNNEFGSKNLSVLVMNPNDGSIIAMSSGKEYDVNTPRNLESIYSKKKLSNMTDAQKTKALNALWKNDAISSGYEPGSTFKPLTVAAALEENLVTEESTFYCDGGEERGGRFIHCSNRAGHGELTLGQALMVSCNDALMQIASLEGKDIFFKYQKSFGLGQKTGIDLPGEEYGLVVPLDGMGEQDLATSSFGQSFTATMIQMAAGFSSLVNGGSYYQPHVMKQIINENGATVKKFDKVLVRQTVSENTSKFLQKYLYQTVAAGSAKNAQVEGYAIGGKTGTAQKLPREDKKYIVSFMGCAPAINPQMVIYVVIDEPQNIENPSGAVACKLASQIMNEILPVLGIFPDGEIDYLIPTQAPTPTPSPDKKTEENTSGKSSEGTNAGSTPKKTESSEFNPAALD